MSSGTYNPTDEMLEIVEHVYEIEGKCKQALKTFPVSVLAFVADRSEGDNATVACLRYTNPNSRGTLVQLIAEQICKDKDLASLLTDAVRMAVAMKRDEHGLPED